jgi:MoxR-like ATPase
MKTLLDKTVQQAGHIILGKEHTIRLALACLMARGHLLIEDLPGVGKTTLAHVLAKILGLKFNRIQFTSDLLPADILGVSVYERDHARFTFHPGPIFAQVLLADEINRTTPKTQSALLEAMEEHQVTIEGETLALPEPFFVIATQNPMHLIGTFPLPESQLDRFMMCIEIGYPGPAAERALLKGQERRAVLTAAEPCLTPARLIEIQEAVRRVHVSEALLDYLQALLEFSRRSSHYKTGLSPRAGLAALHSAQAWALLEGRDHVIPEDVQTVLPGVIGHRLRPSLEHSGQAPAQWVRQLLDAVAIP